MFPEFMPNNAEIRTFARYGDDASLRFTPITATDILRVASVNQVRLNQALSAWGDANRFGIISGSIKDYARIIQKTAHGKGNDFSKIYDGARATILVNSPEQVAQISRMRKPTMKTTSLLGPDFIYIDSSGGFDMVRGSGYRDMKMYFKSKSNGGIVEIQVQVPSMYIAKENADVEYRFRRNLKAEMFAKGSAATEAEHRRAIREIAESEEREKAIFDKAWSEFQAQTSVAK